MSKEYRACLAPYSNFWSSGPYLSKQDDRLKISLLGGGLDKTSTTMTYARYLYAVSSGKPIPPGVEVDHSDGNKYNDTVSNLVALTTEEHRKKTKYDPTRIAMRKTLTLICPHCKKEFTISYSKSYIARGNHASYCSPNCARYSKRYLDKDPIIIKKERVKDILPRLYESWEMWSLEITEAVKDTLPVKKGSALNSLSRKIIECPTCMKGFTPQYSTQKYCSSACSNKRRGRKSKIDETALEGVLKRVHRKELSYSAAGRLLGVSDNAIRKRYLRVYGA